jgi:sugar phosphate isomerase/epimerase
MRIGTTSYIYPADIPTNVQKLAGRVDDVELVIFECDEYGTNLPDEATEQILGTIASQYGMTYTVHLPLDLRLATDNPAFSKAINVIRSTRGLNPNAYVVHVDDGENGFERTARSMENSVRSLERLSSLLGSSELICIENLDNQSPEILDELLKLTSVSCCVDVGHLWQQGENPLPWLERWLPRAKVVHLHGVGARDHEGLSHVPIAELDAVVHFLLKSFDGVVTLEVFSEADLLDCILQLNASLVRATGAV